MIPQKNSKERPVCRFFASTHGCKNGDKCEFFHPKPKQEDNKGKPKPVQHQK